MPISRTTSFIHSKQFSLNFLPSLASLDLFKGKMALINWASPQGHARQLNKHEKVFYLLVAFLRI